LGAFHFIFLKIRKRKSFKFLLKLTETEAFRSLNNVLTGENYYVLAGHEDIRPTFVLAARREDLFSGATARSVVTRAISSISAFAATNSSARLWEEVDGSAYEIIF